LADLSDSEDGAKLHRSSFCHNNGALDSNDPNLKDAFVRESVRLTGKFEGQGKFRRHEQKKIF
jgi:hypothetical protein